MCPVYLWLKDWWGCLLSLRLRVHVHGVRRVIPGTSVNQTQKKNSVNPKSSLRSPNAPSSYIGRGYGRGEDAVIFPNTKMTLGKMRTVVLSSSTSFRCGCCQLSPLSAEGQRISCHTNQASPVTASSNNPDKPFRIPVWDYVVRKCHASILRLIFWKDI